MPRLMPPSNAAGMTSARQIRCAAFMVFSPVGFWSLISAMLAGLVRAVQGNAVGIAGAQRQRKCSMKNAFTRPVAASMFRATKNLKREDYQNEAFVDPCGRPVARCRGVAVFRHSVQPGRLDHAA